MPRPYALPPWGAIERAAQPPPHPATHALIAAKNIERDCLQDASERANVMIENARKGIFPKDDKDCFENGPVNVATIFRTLAETEQNLRNACEILNFEV